jgi:GTP-binding protein EngB required for normal cell division
MKKVCGANNYSLCLRNCEHLARYIQAGTWVSLQMASGASPIRDYFKSYLSTNHTKLINTMPYNLRDEPVLSQNPIYPECETFVQYGKTTQVLNKADQGRFNVLLLGPTGCGKSRLINILFNQTVSKSAATALSVTKDVFFLQGQFLPNWVNADGTQDKLTVNMIDTIGLCDSVLSGRDVYNWIKDRVKVNMMYIDIVVVVCAGRIEGVQADAIKQYLEWLEYKKNPNNFVFVYNKAEDLTPGEKTQNLMQMGEILEVDMTDSGVAYSEDVTDNKRIGNKKAIENRFASGFSPRATFGEIQANRDQLISSIFTKRKARLTVDESMCLIL